MMSIFFIEFPISDLGEHEIYHQSGCFTRIGDFDLVVFLVGVYFREGLWFYSTSPFTILYRMFPFLSYFIPFHVLSLKNSPTNTLPSNKVYFP